MKESELNKKLLQTLNELESIKSIEPSADWNQSLMRKLDASPAPANSTSLVKYGVAMLFIILINVGFVVSFMNKKIQSKGNNELQTISAELLINPISY